MLIYVVGNHCDLYIFQQHALIPSVKTEKRDGSTSNNPYVAFRRRTEKMQTRKVHLVLVLSLPQVHLGATCIHLVLLITGRLNISKQKKNYVYLHPQRWKQKF